MLDDFPLLSELANTCMIKHVYKEHPWNPNFLAIVDRWSLLALCYEIDIVTPK